MARAALIGVMALILLGQAPAPASAEAARPSDRIREIVGAVSGIIGDPSLQGANGALERERRIRDVIYDSFDFEAMSQRALGPHWEVLTRRQREQFVSLFADLFERSYNRLVVKFLGDRTTTYLGESIDEERAIVQTRLEGGPDERLPVEYWLGYRQQRWRIVDIVLDGVSLASNYRAQFGRIIQTSSYDTLVRRMQSKAR